jgi:hypothetical protein
MPGEVSITRTVYRNQVAIAAVIALKIIATKVSAINETAVGIKLGHKNVASAIKAVIQAALGGEVIGLGSAYDVSVASSIYRDAIAEVVATAAEVNTEEESVASCVYLGHKGIFAATRA